MSVCVKSQIMGAKMELGRIRMSKSNRTARLRTSMSQAAYLVGCSQDVATMSLSSWASEHAELYRACASEMRMLTGVGWEIVVLCEPEAAEPRTVSPAVETLSSPKTLTASGKGEIFEGIQALHLDCSTRRPNLASEATQIGQSVRKSLDR